MKKSGLEKCNNKNKLVQLSIGIDLPRIILCRIKYSILLLRIMYTYVSIHI